MTTNTRRPGRPRDPHVATRDETIYQLITTGTNSRSTLAKATGLDRTTVHLSCKRLQRDGRIRKCLGETGNVIWVSNDSTPCT